MKRWKRNVLFLAMTLILGIAGLAFWQRENLIAFYTFATKDTETIVSDMEDKRQEHQQVLQDQYEITVIPPNTQQSNDLLDGKVSPEEVKEALGIIVDKNQPEKDDDALLDEEGASSEGKTPVQDSESLKDSERDEDTRKETPGSETGGELSPEPMPEPEDGSSSNPEPSPEPESPPVSEPEPEPNPGPEPDPEPEPKPDPVTDLVNQCVAELYACKIDLMAQLGSMKQAAIEQWRALPEEERTAAKKKEIGMAGLNACYDLEVQTDAQVKGILGEYRKKLEEVKADTSILDTLWKQYCEEKASEKAYYLDKYL